MRHTERSPCSKRWRNKLGETWPGAQSTGGPKLTHRGPKLKHRGPKLKHRAG
ncbi:hypothetical protein FHT80_003086 [Rhizobium sp. BK226]|nr:hypothetical protein [Rhizobium sp. BK226]